MRVFGILQRALLLACFLQPAWCCAAPEPEPSEAWDEPAEVAEPEVEEAGYLQDAIPFEDPAQEALVQELFVKAFADTARKSWDGLRSYGAWLNTMTRNMLIDRARRERRLDFRAPDDMPIMVDQGPDPADSHDATELHTVLVTFRASLSADEEALFRTRFEDTTSLSQSAKILGWSEIRVRKLDTALRVRLLAALQGAGFVQSAQVTIGASLLGRKPT